MECELAELSSNIQLEAQNLVAHERREHRAELERATRRHREIVQLLEMERAQVGSLKLSLERAARALDDERAEAERLRAAMAAFDRQMSTLIAPAAAAAAARSPGPPSERQPHSLDAPPAAAVARGPHITGRIVFGSDALRPDARLGEFLGFINAASDKEAHATAFMQRSMREDVEPTLAADGGSGGGGASSLLAGWSRHRRLLHAVQDTALVLESYAPRAQAGRVPSPACYLCGCSAATQLAPAATHAPERRTSGRPHGEMYRMRFGDDDAENKALCAHCHARMVAVCSFFAYLKIVRRGLIKRPIEDIWLEVCRARLHMWLVRSGASPDTHLLVATA